MENRKKILIIEDDEDISMIEEAYLESAGFETKILSDGNKVNEKCLPRRYQPVQKTDKSSVVCI